MTASVTVVDYGAGNLLSVVRAFQHLGARVTVTAEADSVAAAERLVLPGVGAFAACRANLARLDLDDPVRAFSENGRPFLGICVGMQMMFEGSDEFGATNGLALLPGWVRPIPSSDGNRRKRKIPHIGWNALCPAPGAGAGAWRGGLLDGVAAGDSVYFVHSFAAEAGQASDQLADCDYEGARLLAAVQRGSLWGCQFHPEKSGPVGLAILKNFLAL